MMIPPSCLVVRVTGGNLDHASIRHDDGFESAQGTAVLRRKELHRDLVTGVQGVRSGFADPALRESCGGAEGQYPGSAGAVSILDVNGQRSVGIDKLDAFNLAGKF